MTIEEGAINKQKIKKVCFIIPYFGKLPNYFQLFLNSCKYNNKFNWLIFTDDNKIYEFPDNVKKIDMTFEECKKIIQNKFDFEICLPTPKKLCDYKPAYGWIFSEYLSEYKFWGYCDLDVIFGDISSFISEQMLEEYDKLYNLGHLTIYRNTDEINTMFMKPLHNKEIYKEIYQTPNMCCFDEWPAKSINNIFIQEKNNTFDGNDFADVGAYNSYFQLVYFNAKDNKWHEENIKNNIFKWCNGKLLKLYEINSELHSQEYMYIHLQKRNMKNNLSNIFCDEYYIVPNKFIEYQKSKELKLINKYKYLIVFNYKALNKKINDIKYSLIEKIRTNIFKKALN